MKINVGSPNMKSMQLAGKAEVGVGEGGGGGKERKGGVEGRDVWRERGAAEEFTEVCWSGLLSS